MKIAAKLPKDELDNGLALIPDVPIGETRLAVVEFISDEQTIKRTGMPTTKLLIERIELVKPKTKDGELLYEILDDVKGTRTGHATINDGKNKLVGNKTAKKSTKKVAKK